MQRDPRGSGIGKDSLSREAMQKAIRPAGCATFGSRPRHLIKTIALVTVLTDTKGRSSRPRFSK
jgi:hypothetical protein